MRLPIFPRCAEDFLFASLLALLSIATLRAETFYTADATYTAGPEPDTYLMKVIIKKINTERGVEKEELVVGPSVTAKLGEPAGIELAGGKKGIDVIVGAFYPAKNDNRSITCTVELKEKGKVTFRTKVSVSLNVRS